MGFWDKLFSKDEDQTPAPPEENVPGPSVVSEDIPNTLNLGWYWSENKQEHQLAKISEKDRATHFYVIGATGTGKTKFLEFLIQQDIEKGNGFGVIDPHGDLIESVKGFLACEWGKERISEKVVLIDPVDPQFTVTFNPLERLPNTSIPEQVGELISAFKKIWADSWGVRMEDLMRNSLIALGEAGFSLSDLSPFLNNRVFRNIILEKVTHPIAKDYFRRFETLTDRGQITWIEPIMNKINAFFSDERIRQMFSSNTNSFNLREVMDNRKILLVKLNKGKLKGSADLLGSLLMSMIQVAAFSRSELPQQKRVPFYLYIDEFQNFASENFAVILSEARKYGLSLIMAHQTLSQISDALRGLILGNTGVQTYFRMNRQDSSLLAKESFEYSGYEVKTMSNMSPKFWSYAEEWEHKTEELQNLPPRFCYVKHKIDGGMIQLQTVEIEPPWEVLGMKAHEYDEYSNGLSFGKKHLVSRKEIVSLIDQRREKIEEEIESRKLKEKKEKEATQPVKRAAKETQPEAEEPRRPEVEEAVPEKPLEPPHEKVRNLKLKDDEKKAESQHRYLQSLIKKAAEDKGYKATIEQSTPDGQGRVDVSLERDGKKIACEISVTSTPEQELGNIEKCLAAGYERVVLCSPDGRGLNRIKDFVLGKLAEGNREKVLFFQPEEFLFFLEGEAAKKTVKEERVKGYKVKVQYQPVKETDKKNKKEAVAQVIIGALKRMKDGK
jgi:hypothetical protein